MPRPERSFRTPALILRRRDFGEADRVLTILTPEHGRLDVLAKGARKPISTKTGHVELFTKADMLINRGRDFGIAAQVEMLHPHLPLREDLQRGAYANYVAELVIRFTADEDAEANTRLFTLVDDALTWLSSDPDPRLTARYFELHLLDMAGFRPELSVCVLSREAIRPEDQFFSFADGGIVSPAHSHLTTSLIPITVNALKLLRHMQRSPYSHVRSLTVTPALHSEVERVMLGYITYLLERRLQSIDFIRRIRV